jgi:hypothetical protein
MELQRCIDIGPTPNVRFWPKADMSQCTAHMSAFRGKADMTLCGNPLSRSLSGVKRTWVGALHMSAFDPKRTVLRSAQLFMPPLWIAEAIHIPSLLFAATSSEQSSGCWID